MSHDLVRPFVMTGGRTRVEHRDLRLETMLKTVRQPPGLPTEQDAILRACQQPLSVAEVAARLDLVVGVAAILVGDLVAGGMLEVHHTDPVDIELDALTRMIEKVRSI
jgi:hypothetical protein